MYRGIVFIVKLQIKYEDSWKNDINYYIQRDKGSDKDYPAQVNFNLPEKAWSETKNTGGESTMLSVTKYTGRLIELDEGDKITVMQSSNADEDLVYEMTPETSFFGAFLVD